MAGPHAPRFGFAVILVGLLSWLPTEGHSQSIYVHPGASLDPGDGSVHLHCGDLTVAGSASIASGSIAGARNVAISGGILSLGSGLVSLSGSWSNTGTLLPGTGSVEIVDGCATTTSTIAGDSTFYRFSVNTGSGRLLQAVAGSTQTFLNDLTLRGSPPSLLTIRSSTSGTPAFFTLSPGATQDIIGVDVADNNAIAGQRIGPGTAASFESIKAVGSTPNWFIIAAGGTVGGGTVGGGTGTPAAGAPEPVDTLSQPALLVLAMLILAFAGRARSKTSTGKSRS